jgi:hypothetical protein
MGEEWTRIASAKEWQRECLKARARSMALELIMREVVRAADDVTGWDLRGRCEGCEDREYLPDQIWDDLRALKAMADAARAVLHSGCILAAGAVESGEGDQEPGDESTVKQGGAEERT